LRASTLIFGATDGVLVDALLIREDVDALGDMIASTGKKRTTIFITHGHGDHFFGSDRLIAHFLNGTRSDFQDFAEAARSFGTVEEIVGAMRSKYPDHGNLTTLLSSAKAAVKARASKLG
jgi:glyoxylase-like metal-dependent hydrolase (beta-lactamase superfamily II)